MTDTRATRRTRCEAVEACHVLPHDAIELRIVKRESID
jgi:hypothetical protein